MPVPVKVALITGCSEPKSVGAALALNLRQHNWRVYATARNLSNTEDLKVAGCDLLVLDVASKGSIEAAAKAVTEQAGRIDLILNNAGVLTAAPALDSDFERMTQVLDINTLGPLRVVQGFSELLIKTATDQSLALEDGHSVSIINTGSGSRAGLPFQAIYGASKAGLYALSEAIRHELSPFGIKVSYVDLNMVGTALFGKIIDSTSTTPSRFYSNWSEMLDAGVKSTGEVAVNNAHTPEQAATDILRLVHENKYPAIIKAGYIIKGFSGPSEESDEAIRSFYGVNMTEKPKF